MQSTFEMPDFAFPETVERDAEKHLGDFLRSDDGCGALRAAMQIIVARNMVSPEAFNRNIALLDSLAGELKGPYSGLALLLEANMYKDLYSSNAWTYNNRDLPTDSYPEDPRSWSRDLFAKRCLELVRGAFGAGEEGAGDDIAKTVPLQKIGSLLTESDESGFGDLTVYDFMTVNAKGVLDRFGNGDMGDYIPFTTDYTPKALNIGGECSIESHRLIDSLYDWRIKQPEGKGMLYAIFQKADSMQREQALLFVEEWMQRLFHTKYGGAMLDKYCSIWGQVPDDLPSRMKDKDLYGLMEMWMKEYPQSAYNGILKFQAAYLAQKTMEVILPNTAMSGREIKGRLRLGNMNECYVLLYSVPENLAPMNSLAANSFPSKGKFLRSIKVTAEGSVPFSEEREFTIEGLAPGYYVAVPSASEKLSQKWTDEVRRWSLNVINVSDIAVLTSFSPTEKGSGRVYAVDASTQRPIAGAEVRFYADDNMTKPLKTLTTDETGGAEILEGFRRMRVSYEGSVVWQYSDVYYNESASDTRYQANILTDLLVYKPGETVRFAVVGWSVRGKESNLLADSEVRVVIRNADNIPVDTVSFRTDRWGRGSGEFTIPKEGLLDYYDIGVSFPGKSDRQVGQTSFLVAEYKAPGFFVTVESEGAGENVPGNPIRFKGEVKTYSGMPVADAMLTYNIQWRPWWRMWYGGVSNASYGGELRSDSEGRFELELPTSGLKGTRFERGIFTLKVSATNQGGETQSAPLLRFSIGEGLSARPAISDKMEVKGDTVRFNVPVYDMLDHPVSKSVGYEIVSVANGKRVAGGSFRSPLLRVPSRTLPSGEYRLTFTVPDDTTKVNVTTAIWRRGDEKPPLTTELWVPTTEIVVPEGKEKTEVTVGTSYTDSWIFCQIADESGLKSRKWYPVSGRNRTIEVEAPAQGGRVWVMFNGMHDHERAMQTVTLVPEADTKRMEIKATSFRDRISAGDKERWVFSVTVDNKSQTEIPAFAVMSDKSLNAIAPFKWKFAFGGNVPYNRTRLNSDSPYTCSTTGTFSKMPTYRGREVITYGWQTYGYSLAGNNRLHIRGTRMMKSAMLSSGKVEEDGESTIEAESVVNEVYMAASADAAAPMANGFGALKEQYVVTTAADAGGSRAEERKEELRPIEMPIAFFKPDLTSDEEGNVNIEFETPNFNTTWQLQLAGYNRDLKSAGLTVDAVASKPVMVQLNQPRYLCTGDKAEIAATLYNNTPENAMLHGEIIIFNPLTGETIVSKHAGEEQTAPAGSRTFTIEFAVGSELTAIGVRAYAYAGNFSDGEQTIVPILPSSTPVVESTQFYLGAGEGSFKVKLPKFRKDDAVTLKYCANPVWECILALPDITTPDSKNVLALSRALYANSLASGITDKYPAVREGLKRVLEAKASGKGSGKAALTSNLEKDQQLKTVALNNTPWVNDASAETLRMERLSTLIEDGEAAKAIESNLNELKNLQNSDGGWSWCGRMSSNLFITRSVLEYFGMMRERDMMPAGGMDMCKRALSYTDRKAMEDYERSGQKFSTVDMLRYLYMRSMLEGGSGPSGFTALQREALKRIAAEWRDFNVYDKATAALLLNRSKGYESETAPILESLTQLASKSENKGWWYDNLGGDWNGMPKLTTTARVLEAFAAINPGSEGVDGLRQWLVLQKETENWGSNSSTVGVIQSILATGSDWTAATPVAAKGLIFKLGGKELTLPEEEMLTGAATVTLDPTRVAGRELEIVKSTSGPAWGGVISQYVAPINEVKAERSENLKVEKQLLLINEGSGGTVAKEVKPGKVSLKSGDKVRVTITLTCEKDMEYVAVIDERSACLEPDEQLSGYVNADGLGAYREIRDTKTSFFIDYLPKGVNVISYDCHVDREGVYSVGITSAQSQYSPLQTAHSAGFTLTSKK